MSELIAVVGETGSGKSRSIKNLNPLNTLVINVVGKPLPFSGWKKNYHRMETEEDIKTKNFYVSDSSDKIVDIMNIISTTRQDIQNIIIDDFQYLLSNEFMNRSHEKTFDKWTDIAKHAWSVLDHGRKLREDIKVFVLTHDQIVMEDYSPKRKIKTLGKLLDDKITLEGLFTVVLFTKLKKKDGSDLSDYFFVTQSDGSTTAKSPEGMFKEMLIPNDLAFVSQSINEYYNN